MSRQSKAEARTWVEMLADPPKGNENDEFSRVFCAVYTKRDGQDVQSPTLVLGWSPSRNFGLYLSRGSPPIPNGHIVAWIKRPAEPCDVFSGADGPVNEDRDGIHCRVANEWWGRPLGGTTEDCCGHLINTGDLESPPVCNNCEFVEYDTDVIWVCATRCIMPGEYLYCSYGSTYFGMQAVGGAAVAHTAGLPLMDSTVYPLFGDDVFHPNDLVGLS